MEDLSKQIVKNTEHKTSFQIIVSDNKSSFNTRLNPKLELDRDKEYEIALVNLETYYSFPNIDETNNVFVYSPDNGNSWVKIKIPEGSYEIDDINNTIKHEMEKRGHYDSINEDYYINISANSNTLKSVLILEKDYQVDFNHQNSLAKVLGFTGTKYMEGFHESENVVNILSINVCDMVTSIFSFSLNVLKVAFSGSLKVDCVVKSQKAKYKDGDYNNGLC